MRVTFAVMEMHMRKRPHLVVLTELVAPAQTPVAQSKTASTFAQGLSLEESLLARVACRHGTRRVQSRCVSCPDALAEYEADNLCTALNFTASADGEAIYPDDGLGRGLTVTVDKDYRPTVTLPADRKNPIARIAGGKNNLSKYRHRPPFIAVRTDDRARR